MATAKQVPQASRHFEIEWPDLTADQAAFALAKAALPNGTVKEQVSRAIDILSEMRQKKEVSQ